MKSPSMCSGPRTCLCWRFMPFITSRASGPFPAKPRAGLPHPPSLRPGCYHTAPRAPSPQGVAPSVPRTLLGNRHTPSGSEEQTDLAHNHPQAASAWPRTPRAHLQQERTRGLPPNSLPQVTCLPSSAGTGTTHAPHNCIQSPQKPPGWQWG